MSFLLTQYKTGAIFGKIRIMRYDPERHHRHSIRLKGFDYAQSGAYFFTICAQDRASLFGEVVDGEMRVNAMGEMVEFTWFDLPNHVDGLVLDAFVVMPNHVHGIVVITRPYHPHHPAQKTPRFARNCAPIQNVFHEAYKPIPANTRHICLAAQLL